MAGADERMTIEQLAARSGMTVRNIRSHTTRGLMPPPYLKGRTGYYGPEHVARLQLISALQQQGFNLAAIRKLVAGPAAPSAEETVAFYSTALGPWLTESPEVWSADDLAASFGIASDPTVLQRLKKMGIVELLADNQVRVTNPALLGVGRQLTRLGYGVEDLLAVLRVLLQHSRSVADAFVQMFLQVHWRAYVDAGMPPERLPELQGVIEQLQPLASQAVVAAFQQAMTETSGRAFERETAALQDGAAEAG